MHINKLSNKKADYPLITQAHALTTKTFMNPLQEKGNGNPPVSPFNKWGICYSNYGEVGGETKGEAIFSTLEGRSKGEVEVEKTFPEGIILPEGKQFIKISEAMTIHEYPLKWTIRHRRSAIDFDGKTTMSINVFHYLMRFLCSLYKADYLIPGSPPLIIPYLYVHRVEGVERGLYCLDRTNKKMFLLSRGDMQHVAKELSLNQDIASDSAFAMSFISNFDYALNTYGNRGYRYIHYEAGFLGQSLYSGATAAGFDATGIGAFIDDEVHTFLKTPSEQQVVYHFTVGKRIDDSRISILPAYERIHDNEEDMK